MTRRSLLALTAMSAVLFSTVACLPLAIPPPTTTTTTTTAAPTTSTAPLSVPPYTKWGDGPKVAMIGSSINYNAAGTLGQYAKTDGDTISVSISFDGSGWQKAALYAATSPDILLIEYGTSGSYANFAAGFAQVQAEFPATCVVWVSVQDHRPRAADTSIDMATWNANQKQMNDLIYTAPHVADWEQAIVNTIGADGYSTLLVADQIHPGPVNAPTLAALEWAGVRSCYV